MSGSGQDGPQHLDEQANRLSSPTPAGAFVDGPACRGTGPVPPESIEIISPDARVPDFHVATTACRALDSDHLIGDRPLVLLFFSSWCGVCDRKMPSIRRTQRKLASEATFVAVAIDDDDTWPDVEPFLERHDVSMPLVRGAWFPRFSQGYNPFGSIPVVVVIGRDGRIIDVQLGYSPFDENRLIGAIEVDRRRSRAEKGAVAPGPVETPSPDGT